MFVGVGEATLTPSGFSMLADLFKPERVSLPISVFTGSTFFGSGVALLAGGFVIAMLDKQDVVSLPLIGVMQPWEAAFVIAALPGIFVALIFLLTIKEPARRQSSSAIPLAEKPALAEVFAFVARNAGVFAAVFGGVSVLAAVQFCLGAWVPAHFIRNHGWTALLAPAVFFGTMAFGAGPALIPVICPARMRGLLVAVYLLIANIVGQAGGPLIVALFTDQVFGSPEMVRYSLMAAPALLLVSGAILVKLGFPGLRAMNTLEAGSRP
jgi:MFS family permease